MSTLTLQSIEAAWFTLILSGSALTAARATLGVGGVLSGQQFANAQNVAGPLIVVTYGPVTGQQYFVRTFYPNLLLYDDVGMSWARLTALADLIEAGIVEDAIPYCQTRYSTGIGAEAIHDTLKRPYLPMRFQIKGRF